MTTNTVLMNFVRSQLDNGGSVYQKWAGIPGQAWCDAFISYSLNKTDNGSLYCNGTKEINCPHSMNWCYKNLALIPIYLALPGDVTFFDWEPNGLPNHVGFVEERISADYYYTIEGNTAGGKVARQKRSDKQEQATFRLHYTPTAFSADKKLEEDGLFGYNSIAVMQRWLKALGLYTGEIDAIWGQRTMKALQKKLGVPADGLFGPKTAKALQKLAGAKQDGLIGPDSVKAFQKYLNAHAFADADPQPAPTPTTKTQGDKIADSAKSYVGKVKYVKGGTSLKTGCDCTGFVQAVHKLHGIKLDVTKSWGKSIGKDISKAKRGDVIYYYKNGKLHHMGIYDGNGKIIHCSTSHKDWHKDCCIENVKLPGFQIGNIRRCWK